MKSLHCSEPVSLLETVLDKNCWLLHTVFRLLRHCGEQNNALPGMWEYAHHLTQRNVVTGRIKGANQLTLRQGLSCILWVVPVNYKGPQLWNENRRVNLIMAAYELFAFPVASIKTSLVTVAYKVYGSRCFSHVCYMISHCGSCLTEWLKCQKLKWILLLQRCFLSTCLCVANPWPSSHCSNVIFTERPELVVTLKLVHPTLESLISYFALFSFQC